MAVNETARDHLRLLHVCDQIDNVIAGLIGEDEIEADRRRNVGNMVMMLEGELLDDRWATYDMIRLTAAIAAGRAFWKG
jgi:hypothetical protein